MSESQYIPDPDELEDDAAGEQDELYEHYSITADRGQSPLRLDKFLTIHMERCSRNRIQTAADAGNILVNGKPAKSSYKVKPGDRISLVMPYPKREIEIIPENIPLEIPYEDDDLLLVNKPAGMVVYPGHGNYSATLVNALTYHLQNLPLFQEGDMRAGLVHRIDKNTSGLLVIAIGTVLSNIKFFTLPNGGSVTLLSMLPFVLVSFRHGVKWGLFTGFVNGCLQMLLGFWAPPTPTFLYFLGEVLLDYLVAFMALGTAEFFARPFKNRMVGVAVGTFMAGFLRFMCSFLSGVLVWGNLNEGLSAWTYSLVYNGSYMLPETLLTMVAAVLLCRVAPQIFDRQHAKA